MNLPPLDKDTLAKMGIAANAVPMRPVLDFGIKIPPEPPCTPKAITPEDANNMFGVSLAVKMNFVPQMLIALALDYASQFVNHCRDNRISEFKKHNRLIRLCVENTPCASPNLMEAHFRRISTMSSGILSMSKLTASRCCAV